MSRQTVPLAAIVLLVGLTIAWGACWPAMKFGVGEIPVLTFRFLTALGGGLFMLGLSALHGISIALPRREWAITTFAALFNVTGWFYLTGLGLTLLPASRASVIAYTMPLFAILAAVIRRQDRMNGQKIAGLCFGLGAVFFLLGENPGRLGNAPLGVFVILCAAACWGFGTALQKREWSMPVLTLAGWQLLIGSLPMGIMAAIHDHAPFSRMSPAGAMVLAYVILIATGFGYWAWFSVLRLVSASVASISVLAVPPIGVVLSALLLGEHLGWREVAALLLVMAALATVLPLPRFFRR